MLRAYNVKDAGPVNVKRRNKGLLPSEKAERRVKIAYIYVEMRVRFPVRATDAETNSDVNNMAIINRIGIVKSLVFEKFLGVH